MKSHVCKLVLKLLVLACFVSLFGCVADYQVETRPERVFWERHPLNQQRHPAWEYRPGDD